MLLYGAKCVCFGGKQTYLPLDSGSAGYKVYDLRIDSYSLGSPASSSSKERNSTSFTVLLQGLNEVISIKLWAVSVQNVSPSLFP